jgi:hypothetical protein
MTSLENGVLKVLQDRFLLTVPTCSHAGAEDASPWLWIPVVMDHRGYRSLAGHPSFRPVATCQGLYTGWRTTKATFWPYFYPKIG